ncbi:hypothetical protein, partial [Sinorhizobium medicae]|uniref:hypothetical protein n=1 Tax=Sinorhizobium medicae TaxID=110321 RepID=UPI001F2F7F3D
MTIGMWLQPIDPNIGTPAMSAFSLYYSVFLDLLVGAGEVRRVEQIGGSKSLPAVASDLSVPDLPREQQGCGSDVVGSGRWWPGRRRDDGPG